MKKVLVYIKKVLQNGMFIFLLLLGIKSFFMKDPYIIVLGSMIILTSILFLPCLDKVLNLIKVKLTRIQKIFIGLTNFIIAAYLIDIEETSYYKCIFPIVLMIVVWIVTIVYSKHKNKKS